MQKNTHIYYLFLLRLQLAALHFNENSSRQQAVTRCGEKRYSIMFPKFKKGGYIVRKVTVEPTYCKCSYIHAKPLLRDIFHPGYIHDLLEETIRQCKEDVPPPSLSSSVPEFLCSGYDRPDKAIAISKHRSRFNPK